MKIVLEMEGVGFIGVSKISYMVFERFDEYLDKKTGEMKKYPSKARYFQSLEAALEDLRCFFVGKKLATARNHCKSIDELLARIEKINKEWEKFYGKYRLKEKTGENLL
jgi:chromosome segregation ATPase